MCLCLGSDVNINADLTFVVTETPYPPCPPGTSRGSDGFGPCGPIAAGGQGVSVVSPPAQIQSIISSAIPMGGPMFRIPMGEVEPSQLSSVAAALGASVVSPDGLLECNNGAIYMAGDGCGGASAPAPGVVLPGGSVPTAIRQPGD